MNNHERVRIIQAHRRGARTQAEDDLQGQPVPHKHVRHSAADAIRQPTEGGATPEDIKWPPSTFPLPLTSLIGREREVTAASALLARPEVRFLTLTGTGGVGKTRLAIAIATEIQGDFPGGICFVSLEPIQDSDLVLSTIAKTLGVQTNTRPPLEALQAALREQHRLLVLDNFEHVVAAAPDLVKLLAACPHLKLLVTSREVLRVRGERAFIVQPLALPDPKHLPVDEALARYGAVALFLERAREVRPTLQVTAATAPLIAEICQHLDGLPLALELAAARLKVLTLQTLQERLEHRLQVLTGGPRDLPARQQTLRQTITWSYDLLAPEEQRLFRLLSVFVNGCTLEAAEAAYSMLEGERTRLLDEVTSLLDKHLLYQREQGDDSPRLLMHETIREYGLEALAANQELEAARRAHAEYYLGLAAAHIESVELAAWLKQLEHDYANLRAALQWALERPAGEVATRLENALSRFLEGDHRLSGGRGSPARSSTKTDSEDAQAQAPTGEQPTFEIPALNQGDHERAAPLDTESPSLPRDPGVARHLTRSLYLLGLIAWIIGDFAMAHLYAEAGLARARDPDEKVARAYLIDLVGQIALDQGEDIRARALLEEGLALHLEVGDMLGSLNSLFFLERALATMGEMTQARVRAEEHLVRSRAIGFQSGIIGTLTFLGCLALEAGNAASASEMFEESLALLRTTNKNLPLAIATNLQGIGVTLARHGRSEDAARLWGAAEALCPLAPEERAFVVRASANVRAELGEEAFAVAWTEGRAMTLEQALAAMERIAHISDFPAQGTRRARKARQHQSSSHHRHNLTVREEEVLRLVARGLTDAQIAEALVISPRTVNAHLRSIYTKLHISSRNAATYFALEHGLL